MNSRCEEPALFGVFDGHGGSRVSEYAAKHLLARVNQLISGRTDLAQPQPDAPTTSAASTAGTQPRTPAAAQDVPDALCDTPSKASGAWAGGGGSASGVGGGGEETSVGVKSVSRAWMKRALDFGFSCTDREVGMRHLCYSATAAQTPLLLCTCERSMPSWNTRLSCVPWLLVG